MNRSGVRTRRKGLRRGIQLLEIVLVLPLVGIVLTTVAISVAGTERSIRSLQQQSLHLATTDRLIQQLREDVHRATQLPVVSEQTLEIDRVEGKVRYRQSDDQLERLFETAEGRSRETYTIAGADSPWSVERAEGLVRFAFESDRGRKEIVAAWPRQISQTAEATP